MESWRQVWRDGFAPGLPTEGLVALAEALMDDDPRLAQGSTTTPPPLMYMAWWPCEAADAIGFVGASVLGGFACTAEDYAARTGLPKYTNQNAATVGQVEEFFAKACFEADDRLGEPAACRWFLNAWDDTPRGQMFRELLAEVELVLANRAAKAAA